MVISDKPYIEPADFFDPAIPRLPENHAGMGYKYGVDFIWVGICNFGVMTSNWAADKPPFSSKPKLLAATVSGLAISYFFKDHFKEKAKRKNYFYYNYIKTHPEEFPRLERRKFKDEFTAWIPCR